MIAGFFTVLSWFLFHKNKFFIITKSNTRITYWDDLMQNCYDH